MDDAHDLVGREQLAALLAAPQAVTVAAGLADRIMTAIAVGEFQPGQRLPAERELSALLGVSRSTVRDALSRVASRGLLEIRRGRSGGAYVASQWSTHSARAVRDTLQPQWKELEQAFDMRRLIEALVASTAAQRRDGEDEERHLICRLRSGPIFACTRRLRARLRTRGCCDCTISCCPRSASASRWNRSLRRSMRARFQSTGRWPTRSSRATRPGPGSSAPSTSTSPRTNSDNPSNARWLSRPESRDRPLDSLVRNAGNPLRSASQTILHSTVDPRRPTKGQLHDRSWGAQLRTPGAELSSHS
jgi:DNA-binding transcriptional regulator YhcF (GntR family)